MKLTAKLLRQGENQIIKALADKGWEDAIAYYGTETFQSKKEIWTAEFEVNHSSSSTYDKLLAVAETKFEGGEYNGDGVIFADTVEIALEIISKLPKFK